MLFAAGRNLGFILVALIACRSAHAGAPPPAAASVTVEIAAATLASDCDKGAARAPSQQKRAADTAGGAPASDERIATACEQTSMQLSVHSSKGGTPTSLKVKRVELFDDTGASLGVLTPRSPTLWSSDGTYRPWDQTVKPDQKLSVSYRLSAPGPPPSTIQLGRGGQPLQPDLPAQGHPHRGGR